MVTNQPDIARGFQSRETVHAINQYLLETLQLQAAEICEHDDGDNSDCRKPKPGMLLRAADRDSHSTDGKFYDRRPLARH
jgi:D-glycero-D-manno-heptose 1,7-bisphosphate phosphatase